MAKDITILGQLSMNIAQASIDKRFGPYDSVADAIGSIEVIKAGLLFGVTEMDGSVTVYVFTKDDAEEGDCKRVSNTKLVHFADTISTTVALSDTSGDAVQDGTLVHYLSQQNTFGYESDSVYVVNWPNRYEWTDDNGTPYADCLYLNIEDSSLYYYDGTRLSPLTTTTSTTIYFNTIEDLKASTDVKAGDIVITKGYYKINDGGGSTFRVVSNTNSALKIYEGSHTYVDYAYNCTWSCSKSEESTPYVDDATLVALQNDLYADIIVPENNEISFLQMGAKPIYSYYKYANSQGYYYSVQEDNKPYMMKWLAFNDRRMTTYNLFVPAGAYSFSETWLLRNSENASACGIRIRGESMQYNPSATIFIPHNTSQKYIIRIGFKTCSDGSYATTSGANGTEKWIPMRSCVFNDIAFGTTKYALVNVGYSLKYGIAGIASSNDSNHIIESTDNTATAGNDGYRYVTKGALWLDSCPYSQFDGLYFTCVAGSSMYLTQCYESHFGYINIRSCGRVGANGYVYPMVYINAPDASDVSACYFYYFNFENCKGNYFYSKTNNFSHNEFNNIQAECSVSTSLPTIRYTTDGTTPTLYSSVYSSSLSLPSSTTTYKARLFWGSTSASKVTTVIYDPSATVLPPAIKIVVGGIKMYCATSGATIYYTTDGTTPTAESTEYTGVISNPTEETVFKAIAVLDDVSSTVCTTTFATGSLPAPSIRVGESTIVMRKVYKGSPIYASINKAASSTAYDTDSDYTTPTFTEDGETIAVFGKWYKWFVFTGNIGLYPNYVNSISTSNFGNGFKKYRTYTIGEDDTYTDIDGNTITDNYVVDNGICYALDPDTGLKIVDYYRHYALFGQDENSGQTFSSFAWNIGTIHYAKPNGDTNFNGPWAMYLRSVASNHSVVINHTFEKDDYPYFFRSSGKIAFAKEPCKLSGAMPMVDILQHVGSQTFTSSISGTISPNGVCARITNASGSAIVNSVSFFVAPNVRYCLRAYCTETVYNYLLNLSSSGGYPLFKWKGLIGIGNTTTPYTGDETVTIPNYGWITIPLPDLGITDITRIYFYLVSGGEGSIYSNYFLRRLFLDVLCPAGTFS